VGGNQRYCWSALFFLRPRLDFVGCETRTYYAVVEGIDSGEYGACDRLVASGCRACADRQDPAPVVFGWCPRSGPNGKGHRADGHNLLPCECSSVRTVVLPAIRSYSSSNHSIDPLIVAAVSRELASTDNKGSDASQYVRGVVALEDTFTTHLFKCRFVSLFYPLPAINQSFCYTRRTSLSP
jgi:hypothetical protein